MSAAVPFLRPRSLGEAVSALAGAPDRWTLVAGATDLMVRMKDGALRPAGLLDLTALIELRAVSVDPTHMVIGALATHADLESDPLVRRHASALAQAAAAIGSPQIRNRGTLGGNVANASPAADGVPPLFVLGAEVGLVSAAGTRWVAVRDFSSRPGLTVRRPDEILAWLRFEIPPDDFRCGFARLAARKALGIAKVSVAAGARVGPDGTLTGTRVALGAVAPTVIRSPKAEAALEGKVPARAVLDAASRGACEDAVPITDIRSTVEYRREMCGVLLRRVVTRLAEAL